MLIKFTLRTKSKGLHEITDLVQNAVAQTGVRDGLCTIFVQHTSASLLIQENADPSARDDLERWFDRAAPEGDSLYRHTLEGPDDMPAHIKAAMTAVSIGVPVEEGRLCLGTWQGIFLFEHRKRGEERRVLVQVG